MTDCQNQPSADEITKSERCAIPREIYNNIAVIASAANKTNCEQQIEVLKEWTELKRLESDCANGTIRDDKLSINLFIYESGPIEEKIEDVLFMQI